METFLFNIRHIMTFSAQVGVEADSFEEAVQALKNDGRDWDSEDWHPASYRMADVVIDSVTDEDGELTVETAGWCSDAHGRLEADECFLDFMAAAKQADLQRE